MSQFVATWISGNMLAIFVKQIPWIIIACLITYILCIKNPKYVNYFIIICAIYGLVRGGYLYYSLYSFMSEHLFSILYGLLMFIPYLTVFLGALIMKIIWNRRNKK